MSGTAFTGVHQPTGPVNTGSGTQHNVYHFHQAATATGRPLGQPFSGVYLEWLEKRFVRPVGMTTAALRLRSEHSILLDAAPGSGREATAKMLLRDIGGRRAVRRFLAEDDNADSAVLAGDRVSDGDRLLLDLSDARGESWEGSRKQLPGLMESVRERRAYLVVLVPHGMVQLGDELAVHRSPITRPDAVRVLMRAIREERLPAAGEPDAPPESVLTFLAEHPPLREVGRLAELFADARRTAAGKTPAHCFSAALKSLRHPGNAVVAHVSKLKRGDQRALLLTTAMLPGARTDVLHHAHRLLLRGVAHPGDERPLLEQEDLSERLHDIGAAVGADGAVSFRRTNFAAAVRDHFWTNRPDLWGIYSDWVDTALRLSGMTPANRDEFVAGFAEQALRTGQEKPLRSRAWQWAQEDPPMLQASIQALGHGLNDTRTGHDFRRAVYHWSKAPRLTVGVTQVLAAVSADVIALSHPDQALVRLHHLARNTVDARQSGVDLQLVRLAREDDRLYRKLLRRLAAGLAGQPRLADVRLFRACTTSAVLMERGTRPHRLIDTAGTLEVLASAWRALLTDADTDEWLPSAEDWLAASPPENAQHDVLLRVLVKAAAAHPSELDRLYVTALRHPCAPRVRHLVDLVQGIAPDVTQG